MAGYSLLSERAIQQWSRSSARSASHARRQKADPGRAATKLAEKAPSAQLWPRMAYDTNSCASSSRRTVARGWPSSGRPGAAALDLAWLAAGRTDGFFELGLFAKELGLVDTLIPEPLGGAHRDPEASYRAVGAAITEMLAEMKDMDAKALITDRRKKFLDIGSKGLAA